jgi:hypothetical protein
MLENAERENLIINAIIEQKITISFIIKRRAGWYLKIKTPILWSLVLTKV